MEDPSLGSSLAVVLPSAVGWLISLRNLRACSLPACIPPPPDFVSITSRNSANFFSSRSSNGGNSGTWQSGNSQTGSPSTPQSTSTSAFTSTAAACRLLNRALISLRYLQRLGLARCHLTGQLKILLNGLSQPLEYLNLQDCCLSPDDVTYLVLHWRPLQRLYELNLSRNNLSNVADETLEQLVRTVCLRPPGQLVCLSIAYTCLSVDRLIWLVGLMVGMNVNRTTNQNQQADDDDAASDKLIDAVSTLRVLCIQSFVPPSREAAHRILYRVARLSKLQRLHLLPAAYAFPASGESDQRELRMEWITHCRNYLRQRARPDVEVL
ncbi:Leucine rich repeat [Paragonimus skrjabini miyazakii]|uniref:Leucine rich repeat n=1 Tax=Paragonimus skrjabini miyazakii TaxID=59628 RepID=A0A8S9YHQ0_9TREM|nr:Leucine rich repeat [Paragonimus skrjabini miyazakii]